MVQTLAVMGIGASLFAVALVISDAAFSFYLRRQRIKERLREIRG